MTDRVYRVKCMCGVFHPITQAELDDMTVRLCAKQGTPLPAEVQARLAARDPATAVPPAPREVCRLQRAPVRRRTPRP